MRRKIARIRLASSASVLLLALASGLGCGSMHAQAHPAPLPPLSVDQIAVMMRDRNQARRAALHSYESRREMTLTYKGLLMDKRASEVVDVTFTAPATKRFTVLSTTGSALLREDVFQREMESEREATAQGDITITPDTYTMRLIGEDRLPQGNCYVLEVSPRNRGKYGYEGRIWVQAPDFAVVRVDARPVENPSFWLKNGRFQSEFEKVGDFWLPERMVSQSHVRLGGEATLTIQYGPYRILSADPLRWPAP